MHLMGFVYRDLKPENILLHHSGHIMLAGIVHFGIYYFGDLFSFQFYQIERHLMYNMFFINCVDFDLSTTSAFKGDPAIITNKSSAVQYSSKTIRF
jgi:serine/threonine protein kinase